MTTARTREVVNTGKGRMDTDLKKSRWVWRPKGNYLDHVVPKTMGNPEILLQDHAVVDSGCSSHMTGNKAYLSDYEDYNGGFVAFGSDPKGGKITGKGKIKTANLDFDDVYFVDELKFNLFSVSQMCDKKNSVLFTETECLILSPSFKLLDESQVVLRAPRKDDVYSLDLKNIVPSGGITCLYANATADESKLWHRRLGHVNFKNINKLVKGHLVRGLPSKVFVNDHTCVACKKGGFSLVFFLATKDEFYASIRSDLLFDDADGIDYLPNQAIFDAIQLMGHFDAKKKFVMYPRFILVFLDKQLKNVPMPLDHFPINALTSKVFSFMVKKGKHFSRNVTPLFESMLVQPTKDEGEALERQSEPQPIPYPPHPKGFGKNHGGQSSSDRSLSGNKDGLTLQSIKQLKKKAKPVITHHKAWMKSVSMKQRLAGKKSLKKKWMQKEFVSNYGRKSAKSEPTMHKDPAFDEVFNDVDVNDAMDYMKTNAYLKKG
ncbi:ribonuclease H-like domain-containing protein, partial [Tanacetum coccineum]